MKQTAVEWLISQLKKQRENSNNDLQITFSYFEIAKKMEKQQIIDAFWNGDNSDCTSEQNSKEFAEQYYNETYKHNI